MRPLREQILIKPIAPNVITSGGIHIPEVAQKRTGLATVLKISPDIKPQFENDILPQEGNTIMLGTEAGDPVYYNNEDCLIVTVHDVWAIV